MQLRLKQVREIGRLWRRATGGSTAVEFGLVAMISLEFLTEAMQAGLYFYASAGVERAASAASRALMTGSVYSQNMNAEQFRQGVVCPPLAAAHLACDRVITNVQTISEGLAPAGYYALVNQSQTALVQPPLDNGQTSYCIGGSGSYVVFQLLYAVPVFSPIWKLFATTFAGTPSYVVQATSAFRNEPFPGSPTC